MTEHAPHDPQLTDEQLDAMLRAAGEDLLAHIRGTGHAASDLPDPAERTPASGLAPRRGHHAADTQPPHGAIRATTQSGSYALPPGNHRRILFGRDFGGQDSVNHLGFGVGDWAVSGQQGMLSFRPSGWRLRNTGRLRIQLFPSLRVLDIGDEAPLNEGYTVLAVRGAAGRHEMELHIASANPMADTPAGRDTHLPEQYRPWPLTRAERLTLVALSRRFLLGKENYPVPLTWKEAVDLLNVADPGGPWTARRAGKVVSDLRHRLTRCGVAGLVRDPAGEPIREPVGTTLTQTLILELLRSETLVPADLEVLPDD
jgi:hypothetical protein